ncbi:MAG: RluA family pseudouridine synthase [Rhodospirillaceae bacterium]
MAEKIHTFPIDTDKQGWRLDKALSVMMQQISRSRIKVLIEMGCVRIDDRPITDPNQRLKKGFVVTVDLPAPVADHPEPQSIQLDVHFEDEHIIVVNKPAGLVVHPAAGNPDGTLVNALLAHCGDSLRGIGGVKRPGIVHRLDKDTSGLLVVAKTEIAHNALSKQFADHSLDRRYTALVWGTPSPTVGTITGAIGRSSRNRKKMAVVNQGGKDATTHYRMLSAYGTIASLIECRLETGRTHQIRVHMAHAGNSIIGDPIYGRGVKRGMDKALVEAVKQFGRQALHARFLGFKHPTSEEFINFTTDVPPDFTALQLTLGSFQ